MRIFIAIDPGNEIKEKIQEIKTKIDVLGSGVKWVEKENLHITLKFLGEINETMLNNVKSCIENIKNECGSFDIKLCSIGVFPNVKDARVIWVDIKEGQQELKLLSEKIDAKLNKIGFSRENRPFSPHLTIGRVKGYINPESLKTIINDFKDYQIGKFTVKSICIMRSILKPTGPVYSLVSEFKFEK